MSMTYSESNLRRAQAGKATHRPRVIGKRELEQFLDRKGFWREHHGRGESCWRHEFGDRVSIPNQHGAGHREVGGGTLARILVRIERIVGAQVRMVKGRLELVGRAEPLVSPYLRASRPPGVAEG
jgi:hypothetical protein